MIKRQSRLKTPGFSMKSLAQFDFWEANQCWPYKCCYFPNTPPQSKNVNFLCGMCNHPKTSLSVKDIGVWKISKFQLIWRKTWFLPGTSTQRCKFSRSSKLDNFQAKTGNNLKFSPSGAWPWKPLYLLFIDVSRTSNASISITYCLYGKWGHTCNLPRVSFFCLKTKENQRN